MGVQPAHRQVEKCISAPGVKRFPDSNIPHEAAEACQGTMNEKYKRQGHRTDIEK